MTSSKQGEIAPSNQNRPKVIRVTIVDDHPAILLGLRSMLSEEDAIDVIATLDNGPALEQWNDTVSPEVVLLDLRMPRLSGIDCISVVLRRFPLARILIISSYDMDEEIFRALEAGALGYISKSASQEEMTRAIRTVHSGVRSLPPRIAQRLQYRNHRDNLTARELEILKSVARGHTSRQIAGLLHISEFTVRNHVNHIISKLHAQDRTDAAVIGLKKGFISLEEV